MEVLQACSSLLEHFTTKMSLAYLWHEKHWYGKYFNRYEAVML